MRQKPYCRLTLAERCQISVSLQNNKSLRSIAQSLGRHVSSISIEVKRNSIWMGTRYQAPLAHSDTKKRRVHCHRPLKVTDYLEGIVIHFLFERWSPEQIAHRFGLGTQTIYNFIYDREPRLRVLLRRYNKRGAGRYLQRRIQQNDGRISIEHRPESVEKRSRIGHWERDTAQAKNGCLLVCVERKTRLTKLHKVKKVRAKKISNLTLKLIEDSGLRGLSYTNDNGSEFSDGKNMPVPVYYCRPMKPQQRGTVENTIGLLREYITRKTNLDLLDHHDIRAIENSLNNRPRKCLDYSSPAEVAGHKMLR